MLHFQFSIYFGLTFLQYIGHHRPVLRLQCCGQLLSTAKSIHQVPKKQLFGKHWKEKKFLKPVYVCTYYMSKRWGDH